MQNTQLIPYLNFNGKCSEAMLFYQQCIGGELMFQKIGESPMAVQLPSSKSEHILHSQLVHHAIVLMGSDVLGEKTVYGNSIGLCLNCVVDKEIVLYFNALASGGTIKTPLHQTFWGSTYGELTDKYGINWMLNFSRKQINNA